MGRDAVALVRDLRKMTDSDPQKMVIVDAFVGSLKVVWWILVALTTLLAILTLFTRDFSFEKVAKSSDNEKAEVESSDVEASK